MIKVHDFKCSNGHIFEKFCRTDEAVSCHCGAETKRLISGTKCYLDPTGGFPGAASKWIREHERAGSKESRQKLGI